MYLFVCIVMLGYHKDMHACRKSLHSKTMKIYAHLANVLCHLIASFDCMLYLPFINHHINTATAMITIIKTAAKMITTITPVETPKNR